MVLAFSNLVLFFHAFFFAFALFPLFLACVLHRRLAPLDVRNCEASRDEDRLYILSKIQNRMDVDHFNEELRNTIKGIAFSWMRGENKRLRSEISKHSSETDALRSEISNLKLRSTQIPGSLSS